MLDFKRARRTPRKSGTVIPRDYLEHMKGRLTNINEIDEDLYQKYNVKRGLRNANGTGVVVGLTKISDVHGYDVDENNNKVPIEGELFYRGYEVKDLVRNYIAEDRFGFEEVTYLLLFGELPTPEKLETFKTYIGEKRDLPTGFARDMILTAPSNNIMNKLARSVLALYCYDDDPDNTELGNVLKQSIGIIGYFPALIAYAFQAKQTFYDNQSMHLHYPVPELGTAENVLRMLRPTGEFTDLEAKALDISLVLHADHGGGNNSTFTTHLISSSGTDTYSAIAAAIGSLKGPRHGGANISVTRMMMNLKANVRDITNRKAVDEYLTRVLKGQANDGSGLIYGMGHAIYTKSDPRAVMLKGIAHNLAKSKGLEEDFALYDYIEQRTPSLFAEVTGKETQMCANVDLYSGFVYNALNIPMDVATPFFAMARLSGWCAHRLEELIAGKKLMRPAYVNVQPRQTYIPLEQREEPPAPKKTPGLDELELLQEAYTDEIKKLRQDNIQNLRQVKETSDRIRELREKTEKVNQAIEEESQKNGRK